MTSSPDRLLRGSAAADAPAARLDSALGARRAGVDLGHDARLVDPTLGLAFDAIAESVRAAARAEGYAIGWAQGTRDAAASAAAAATAAEDAFLARAAAGELAVARAVTALSKAADTLESCAVAPATEFGDALTAGAFELATILLGRELVLAAEPGMDAVRRALALLPVGRPVTARLHPQDASVVRAALAAMAPDELGRDILVVDDQAVEPAGALVECDASRVDAQLGPALARVREALGQ